MSERIARVVMKAFRGVPQELAVDLPGGSSAAIFGDNATGKSTIADAIEWYFTSQIDRLRHEGRQHAVRHIGAADEDARSVTIETTGSLGGTVVIDGSWPAAVLEAGNETFLLGGRTLAAFVELRKAEKWKVLAKILGLEAMDQLRLDLQTARNELRNEADAAEKEEQDVARALSPKVNAVSEDGIVKALMDLCKNAGVPPPTSMTQISDGTWTASLTDSSAAAPPHGVEIATLASELDAATPPAVDANVVQEWNEAVSSGTPLDHARLTFMRAADGLLAELPALDSCPLCGQQIDREALSSQVRTLVEELQASAQAMDAAAGKLTALATQLDRAGLSQDSFRSRAAALGVDLPPPAASPGEGLRQAISNHVAAEPKAVHEFVNSLLEWQATASRSVRAAVPAAPTPRDQTLVDIGVLATEARAWMGKMEAARAARRAADLSDAVFSTYETRERAYFETALGQISDRVADIYTKLHPAESVGNVSVEPMGSKGVELAATFYGQRQKPPHGVLSESHLNSLGVALFLAMAETFNHELDFLVLDDVVNSFDIEHRGELARLLATEFGHRQLIVLTHDHLFYDRLCRLAPSWKHAEFTSWRFEEGPRTTEYATSAMMEKATRALDDGDVNGAATKGRRALEELLQEICEALCAPLPFRRGARNDRREAGELLRGLRRLLRDRCRDVYGELKPLVDELEADVAAALNVEVHAGRGHASAAEVSAALARIAALDARWTCPHCHGRIWSAGGPDVFRCTCGKTPFPPPKGDPT